LFNQLYRVRSCECSGGRHTYTHIHIRDKGNFKKQVALPHLQLAISYWEKLQLTKTSFYFDILAVCKAFYSFVYHFEFRQKLHTYIQMKSHFTRNICNDPSPPHKLIFITICLLFKPGARRARLVSWNCFCPRCEYVCARVCPPRSH